ncbi:MAG: transcription antitermination factor NusB [Kiritimatiellae bacterium]|nr:transcription antitermination factor NusB [Kiritimatiellia bacterium]
MSTTRRQAREWAIQMLTAADLNPPEDVSSFIASFWEELGDMEPEEGGAKDVAANYREFAEERVVGVLGEKKEIDETLVGLLDNWDLYRLGTVERAVLRMGVWELKNTDVPKAVVINEAIDLANWFSSPKSRTLINAVLDRYGKELK